MPNSRQNPDDSGKYLRKRGDVHKTDRYVTAGGVVVNQKGELLVLERHVKRNGSVVHELRLPKGHIDAGETLEQCALREVGEESGYWNLRIISYLGEVHSCFQRDHKIIERTEHYYLMTFIDTDETRGVAQPVGEEEALFVPRWVLPSEICKTMTYSSEKEIVCRAESYLKQRNTGRL
jgi:ADP-ribose pyrophosphatase YjhB (NUDIX family)